MTLVEAIDRHDWSPEATVFIGHMSSAGATSESGLSVIMAAAVLLAQQSEGPAERIRLGAEFAHLLEVVCAELDRQRRHEHRRRPALHVVGGRDGD